MLANASEPLPTSFSPTTTPDFLTDWPPEKLTQMAVENFLIQTQTPGPKPTLVHELGILEGVAPPFNTETFWSGGNQWNGYVNNVFTMILAGAYGHDRQQGLVISMSEIGEDWIDAPERNGTLRISAANDTVLTLTSTQGSVYQLDLNTKTFFLSAPGF